MTTTTISVPDAVYFPSYKEDPRPGRFVAELSDNDPYHVELLGYNKNNECVLHVSVPSEFVDLLSKVSQEIRWQHEANNSNS